MNRLTGIHDFAGLLAALFLAALIVEPAAANPAAKPCRNAGTDDTLRSLPRSMVPVAKRLFGISAPPAQIQRSTFLRCLDGKALLCNLGANLPCGKANTSRASSGAAAWCRDHPDAEIVPMFTTGHDTIYRWSCKGGAAEIVEQTEQTDVRGFIARYWKPAD